MGGLDFVSMEAEEQQTYKKYLEDLASDRGTLEFNFKKGKSEGIPIKMLIKMTGLTREEIDKL